MSDKVMVAWGPSLSTPSPTLKRVKVSKGDVADRKSVHTIKQEADRAAEVLILSLALTLISPSEFEFPVSEEWSVDLCGKGHLGEVSTKYSVHTC